MVLGRATKRNKVTHLASKVNELRAQLDTAVQAKEKTKASMSSLGELLAVTNHDLKKAIERSTANFEKASTSEIEKSQLQEKVNKLETEQASWVQTKGALSIKPFC